MFSIGDVASRLGVSVQVLRLYEQRGLILVHKGPGGQRQYSESDVERLQCVRTAITEHKISIEGIRRLQSLVPCWEHVRCSARERNDCPAFTKPTGGCWTHSGRHPQCRAGNCRQCDVYRLSSNCDSIKSLIQGIQVHRDRRPSKGPIPGEAGAPRGRIPVLHTHHPRQKDTQS